MASAEDPPGTGEVSANMHFIRPNDGIYLSEGPDLRTIALSPAMPPAMARSEWRVEDFELHKELYRGKTSLLYMATDKRSGMQVALKLYRKRKLSTLNRYQVEREIRLHINLTHENIIKLFSAFEDEKHVYMVQEFAVCGDLFEDLKRGGGQLKEKYAIRDVLIPFLSALGYLHQQGIIHRDIKPENILLGAGKVVKVADFGLSINVHHERPVTRAGTLDYMAPEVLVCPDKRRPEENKDKVLLAYTAQVDSWAVGILAYELLVGYPPFEQESRAATYEHIMYKEPKFPAWMSEEAKKFIGLALCKNATQRPTVFDLLKHSWLQPYLQPHRNPNATVQPSRLRNSISTLHDTNSDSSALLSQAQAPPAPTNSSSFRNLAVSPPPPPAATSSGSYGSGVLAAASSPKGRADAQLVTQMPSPQPTQMTQVMSPTKAAAALLRSQLGGGVSPSSAPSAMEVDSPAHTHAHHPHDTSMPDLSGRGLLQPVPDPHHSLLAAAAASSSHIHSHGSLQVMPAAGSGELEHGSSSSGLGSPRPPVRPPPINIRPAQAITAADMAMGDASSAGGVGELPPSPFSGQPSSPSGGSMMSRLANPPRTLSAQPQPMAPRTRMGPPTLSVSTSGLPLDRAGPTSPCGRGPLSPKPSLTASAFANMPTTAGAGDGSYHRPASGVLSDDTAIPFARSGSLSHTGAVSSLPGAVAPAPISPLSPLQAAVLGPHRSGSSRLNSPSHSRRNSASHGHGQSVSTSGMLPATLSMPLPALHGVSPEPADPYASDTDAGQLPGRLSQSGKHSKLFSKMWNGRAGEPGSPGGPMGMGMADANWGGEVGSSSGGTSFTGGRSSSLSRRLLLTPPGGELRPLMRESSVCSSPKAGAGLREEISQGSLTVYMRPGKTHGVGRAALAARADDADSTPNSLSMGMVSPGGHGMPGKAKSLVARALGNAAMEEMVGRTGSDAGLAARGGGGGGSGPASPGGRAAVAQQHSFTNANTPLARKLAGGAIATKVSEYVAAAKGKIMGNDADG